MTTDEDKHRENAETLLDHADDMVEKEDHLQASEKIWGTVAHTLKEIAERHGWPNDSHGDLGRIAEYLAAVSRDDEINDGYESAVAFHRNFYEDEYEITRIERGVRKAEDTVERLRKAGAQVDEGALPPNGGTSPDDYFARLKHTGVNATRNDLRQQGLNARESDVASQIVRAAQPPMVDALSFKIGADRRRVTIGGDGKPKVGKPAPQPLRLTAKQMEELTAGILDPQPPRRRRNSYWGR